MAQEGVPMQMSENERRQIIGMVGRWAEETEMVGLRAGIRLKGEGKLIATRAGVKSLGLVRVVYCDALPVPSNNALYQLGRQLGVFADTHIGLTIGHAVFLKRGPELRDNGILAHELMHVAQVERLGGLWGVRHHLLRPGGGEELLRLPSGDRSTQVRKALLRANQQLITAR